MISTDVELQAILKNNVFIHTLDKARATVELFNASGHACVVDIAAFDLLHPHMSAVLMRLLQERRVTVQDVLDLRDWLEHPLILKTLRGERCAVEHIERMEINAVGDDTVYICAAFSTLGAAKITHPGGARETVYFPQKFTHTIAYVQTSYLDKAFPGWHERLIAADTLGLSMRQSARHAFIGGKQQASTIKVSMSDVQFHPESTIGASNA